MQTTQRTHTQHKNTRRKNTHHTRYSPPSPPPKNHQTHLVKLTISKASHLSQHIQPHMKQQIKHNQPPIQRRQCQLEQPLHTLHPIAFMQWSKTVVNRRHNVLVCNEQHEPQIHPQLHQASHKPSSTKARVGGVRGLVAEGGDEEEIRQVGEGDVFRVLQLFLTAFKGDPGAPFTGAHLPKAPGIPVLWVGCCVYMMGCCVGCCVQKCGVHMMVLHRASCAVQETPYIHTYIHHLLVCYLHPHPFLLNHSQFFLPPPTHPPPPPTHTSSPNYGVHTKPASSTTPQSLSPMQTRAMGQPWWFLL